MGGTVSPRGLPFRVPARLVGSPGWSPRWTPSGWRPWVSCFVLALALMGIAIAGLARAIVIKVVTLAVALGLIAAVWSQRQSLLDCVERASRTR